LLKLDNINYLKHDFEIHIKKIKFNKTKLNYTILNKTIRYQDEPITPKIICYIIQSNIHQNFFQTQMFYTSSKVQAQLKDKISIIIHQRKHLPLTHFEKQVIIVSLT